MVFQHIPGILARVPCQWYSQLLHHQPPLPLQQHSTFTLETKTPQKSRKLNYLRMQDHHIQLIYPSLVTESSPALETMHCNVSLGHSVEVMNWRSFEACKLVDIARRYAEKNTAFCCFDCFFPVCPIFQCFHCIAL